MDRPTSVRKALQHTASVEGTYYHPELYAALLQSGARSGELRWDDKCFPVVIQADDKPGYVRVAPVVPSSRTDELTRISLSYGGVSTTGSGFPGPWQPLKLAKPAPLSLRALRDYERIMRERQSARDEDITQESTNP